MCKKKILLIIVFMRYGIMLLLPERKQLLNNKFVIGCKRDKGFFFVRKNWS